MHPDDLAVDRFAAVMKAKLARKRVEGRGGWDGPDCDADTLSRMLREHVEKGDPVDVGNLAMMLHQRGERIAPAAQDGEEEVKALKAEVERLRAEREDADQSLVDRYRDPKSGRFDFPGDVAKIVRSLDDATVASERKDAEIARLREALTVADDYLTNLQTPGSDPLARLNYPMKKVDRNRQTAEVRNDARKVWAVVGNVLFNGMTVSEARKHAALRAHEQGEG